MISARVAHTACARVAGRRIARAASSTAARAALHSAPTSLHAVRHRWSRAAVAALPVRGAGGVPHRACSGYHGPGELVAFPALSPTMESGRIARWVAQPGQAIAPGTVIAEVETDKAVMDWEATDDGVLAAALAPDGATVHVGTPIAVIVEDEAEVAAAQAAASKFESSQGGSAPAPAAAPAPAPAPAAHAEHVPGHVASPAAAALMRRHGLQAGGLAGTGKSGRITKGDVLAHLGKAPAPAPAASSQAAASEASTSQAAGAGAASAAPQLAAAGASVADRIAAAQSVLAGRMPEQRDGRTFTDSAPSTMRKVIASRLTESKVARPHYYVAADMKLDAVLALRKQLKALGIAISVNDLLVKACGKALRDVPAVNARWDADSGAVVSNSSVDISVAVATPAGLITPIVQNADVAGLADINARVKDLAGRARANKLAPSEYQGGSFTISNLGMFGISEFTAVINPPQSAILAVGEGRREMVFDEVSQDLASARGDDAAAAAPVPSIKPATVMTAQLSADRRVVDEATAAAFLASVRAYLENPTMLVV